MSNPHAPPDIAPLGELLRMALDTVTRAVRAYEAQVGPLPPPDAPPRPPPKEIDPSLRADRPVGVDIYEGWKEISAALGVSEHTAQSYAERDELPLVVYCDHRGRRWTPRAAVDTFVTLMTLPLHSYQLHRGRSGTPSTLIAERQQDALDACARTAVARGVNNRKATAARNAVSEIRRRHKARLSGNRA